LPSFFSLDAWWNCSLVRTLSYAVDEISTAGAQGAAGIRTETEILSGGLPARINNVGEKEKFQKQPGMRRRASRRSAKHLRELGNPVKRYVA
jgi:hypothetical protein